MNKEDRGSIGFAVDGNPATHSESASVGKYEG
jgi:hypothetical protein